MRRFLEVAHALLMILLHPREFWKGLKGFQPPETPTDQTEPEHR